MLTLYPKRYKTCVCWVKNPTQRDLFQGVLNKSVMNNLSVTVKMLRKQYDLTQEELSLKSGVGLRFVRDLEQGKETLRLDKVNQLLDFFNYEMLAMPKTNNQ